MSEYDVLKERVCQLEDDVKEVKTDVKEIINTLKDRPSWPVVALITFLTSTTVGLIVAQFGGKMHG